MLNINSDTVNSWLDRTEIACKSDSSNNNTKISSTIPKHRFHRFFQLNTGGQEITVNKKNKYSKFKT